jgi:hypothetical protein
MMLFLTALAAGQNAPGGRGGPREAPKNLKLLKADQLMPAMRAFRTALGVRCDFCHVQGNFASDDNPKKQIARKMIALVDQVNAAFEDGKAHVTCYTCHRGAEEPATTPPAPAQPGN